MKENKQLIIIGAGGFSIVVAEAAQNIGYSILGFIDDKRQVETTVVDSLKVIGKQADLKKYITDNVELIIAIGNCKIRAEIFNKLSPDFNFTNIIHPKANISKHIKIGNGNIILAGSTINANCIIGNNNIINSNVLIDHDSEIHNNCHIAQATIIGSNVLINNGITSTLGQKINSFSQI